ncbi:MAG: zinc ribbon domain-containing protein, partial [Acidobacteriota bacterium]
VKADFGKYGLELSDFFIGAITPPEDVQKVIDERSGMSAVGNMGNYMQFKAAKAMEEAAANPEGGGAGAGMGLGVGAGMGMMMPGMIQNAMKDASGGTAAPPAQGVVCAACGKPNPPGARFCQDCGKPLAPAGITCPTCGAVCPPGSKFCTSCGKPVVPASTVCGKCQTSNPAGAKFCQNCGAPLA